jgi:ABC-type transport system involved in cytochrome c biogenesis permease subunit
MTALMAMGIGMIMTAIAVAIGGLVIEVVLLLIHHSLTATARTVNQQAGHAVVFQLERRDDLAGTVDWAGEVAA